MANPLAMFGFKIRSIFFSAIAVGTSTIQDAPRVDESAHIFTMSDGNLVAIYYDGTNLVYRIRTVGVWSAATTIQAGDVMSKWTRNGDTIYGASCDNTNTFNVRVRKLVYAAGAITATSAAATSQGGVSPNMVLGVYWDATNGYIHVFHGSGNLVLQAWDSTLTGKIAATTLPQGVTFGERYGLLVGDGSSTFFQLGATNAGNQRNAPNVTKWVAGATTYTTTNETGVPVLTGDVNGYSAVYDGTNITFIANETDSSLVYFTRTGVNTYSARTVLATTGLGANALAAICRKGTGAASDLIVYYKRTTGQANGEIYYLKRKAGVWDAAPGTLLAGGAATGWSNPSAAASDLNLPAGAARVIYMTGTANPFTVTENGINV